MPSWRSVRAGLHLFQGPVPLEQLCAMAVRSEWVVEAGGKGMALLIHNPGEVSEYRRSWVVSVYKCSAGTGSDNVRRRAVGCTRCLRPLMDVTLSGPFHAAAAGLRQGTRNEGVEATHDHLAAATLAAAALTGPHRTTAVATPSSTGPVTVAPPRLTRPVTVALPYQPEAVNSAA